MDDLFTDHDAADILDLSLGDLEVLADELGVGPDQWTEDDLDAARELLEEEDDEDDDLDEDERDEDQEADDVDRDDQDVDDLHEEDE